MRVAFVRLPQPAFRTPPFREVDLAAVDGALGEQPGDDVHDPGRDLQRLAGEGDAGERIELFAVRMPGLVEIMPRFVGQHHRLRIEGVDQPRRDPGFRFGRVFHRVEDGTFSSRLERAKAPRRATGTRLSRRGTPGGHATNRTGGPTR